MTTDGLGGSFWGVEGVLDQVVVTVALILQYTTWLSAQGPAFSW